MSRSSPLSRRLSAALVVWLALAVGAVLLLATVQRSGRREIDARFAQRATIAGRFVSTYVADVIRRERAQGEQFLSAKVADADFDRVVAADSFGAAVLLDGRGRLLRVFPHKPELLGADLATKYAHLATAVTGRTAISKVVPAAATGAPIVGFAVPFDTPAGRRVFSGAQAIGSSAAGSYLRNAVTLPGARLYLLDPAGVVIARNGPALTRVTRLAAIEPAFARNLASASIGGFAHQRYVSAPIAGTPWRVAIAVPSSVLYRSMNGTVRWLPWLVLVGFVFASLFAIFAVARVIEARRRLLVLNRRLEEIVRVDPLTGLFNRRGLDEHMVRAISAARRHDQPLTVMLLDVDHFKRINDTRGHQAGDLVLADLAHVVVGVLRAEDVVGRWGGEEFLVMLPETDAHAAAMLAERLLETIADRLGVTVSIGVATSVEDSIDERIAAADRALYAAKDAGRNRVCVATPAVA